MMGDVTGWMILGQLAHILAVRVGDDSDLLDAKILFEIGQCPFPLLRANDHGLGHLEHDLGPHGRVLCTEQGVIEATTQAMAGILSRPWDGADDFVAAVLKEGSLPLLHRLMIPQRTVRRFGGDRAEWAEELLRDHVMPEIEGLLAAPPRAKGTPASKRSANASRRNGDRVSADDISPCAGGRQPPLVTLKDRFTVGRVRKPPARFLPKSKIISDCRNGPKPDRRRRGIKDE